MRTVIVFLLLAIAASVCDAQWYQQNSGTTASLRSVAFTDANTGTVVGDSGTILRTTNGGQTWIQQQSGTSYPLNDVCFTDANTGTAVGGGDGPGVILRTTNGGVTWTTQLGQADMWLQGVYFTDANTGTAVGYGYDYPDWHGLILRTINAGQTWIQQQSGTSYPLNDVCFADANIGFVVGGYSNITGSYRVILHTTNAGTTWIVQLAGGMRMAPMNSVSVTDANTATAVGDTILRTTNGGASWTRQLGQRDLRLRGVSFTDANTGTAVGIHYYPSMVGLIVRTTNGGVDWTTQLSQSGMWLRNVCFTDANTGWAVGDGGIILHTTNGGYTGRRLLVPSQYATIQAAIDASVNGDTVLVFDSTYYENIRFKGKRIVVASTYITTGDTSHIANTIIDGSQPTHPDSGSVVYFINGEDTTSVLRGFTIRGGSGTREYDWGFWWRLGGGVFCRNSGARIMDNIIACNRLSHDGVAGGGVMALCSLSVLPYLILERNKIVDNFIYELSAAGSAGGGACLAGVNCRMVGNIFERDSANGFWGAGAGLIFQAYPYSSYAPSAVVRGNIFRNNVAYARGSYGAVGVGMLAQQTADVTISENLFEGNTGTSVSGWAQGGGLCVTDQDISNSGRKVITKNRFLNNRLSRGGGGSQCGAGLYLYYTLATVDGNEIAGNSANGTGGGIATYRSSFRIQNNIIARNSTEVHGGGLDIMDLPQAGTEQLLINNTIFDNNAASYSGGMIVRGTANIVSLNNIFWADTALLNNEIYVDTWATANVHYCDVQGGWPSGTGNINADPQFVLPRLDSLQAGSPCIDAGRDTLISCCRSDYHKHIRPWPRGARPDIGVEEYGSTIIDTTTDVVNIPRELPQSFALSQNYPNPFNPITTINYQLPAQSHVTLAVYDLLGRKVAMLVNGVEEPGCKSVQWNASGVASGVYFYRLEAGSFRSVKKLLLLR